MVKRTLILAAAPGDDDALDEFDACIDLLELDEGISLQREQPQRLFNDVIVHGWSRRDRQGSVVVQVMDDGAIPARWVSVRAEDPAVCQRIVDHLALVFRFIPEDELAAAARHPEHNEGALLRLALGVEGRDTDLTRELIVNGLRHASAEVRSSALLAIGVLKWRPFEGDVRQVLTSDPDDGNRRMAEALLKEYAARTD